MRKPWPVATTSPATLRASRRARARPSPAPEPPSPLPALPPPGAAVPAAGLAAATGLEDRLALVLGDPWPIVLDEVRDRAVEPPDRDRDRAPPVAACVLDHRLQDPLAEVVVDADPEWLR